MASNVCAGWFCLSCCWSGRIFCFSLGVDVTMCVKGFLCCGVGMVKGV